MSEQKQYEWKLRDLGLSFGRTFPLIRTDIAIVLQAYADGVDVTDTMVANAKIPAAKGYCRRAGLINDEQAPTLFGEQVLLHDPNLVRFETLWLLHYFLAASHYSVPNFWSDLVVNTLSIGKTLNVETVKNRISEFAIEKIGVQPSVDTLDSAATSFLGTYAKKTALSELNIFPLKIDKSGDTKEQSGQYQMGSPQPIPQSAFACVLADYWQAHFPTNSIDEELLTQGELARVLLLGTDGFNAKLAELADPQCGLVQRQRRFNPPQVLRRWTDPAALWADLYA